MIQTDQKALSEKLREYRLQKGWNISKFCAATDVNFNSYTQIERTRKSQSPRPIGLKIFKQLAEYFIGRDVGITKELLSYAALNPKDLLPMLVADAWIPVGDSLPRDYTKLPGDLKHVNVTYIRCEGCKERVTRGYCTRGGISPQKVQWDLDGYGGVEETDDGFKIIAWQPLPKPLPAAGVAEAVAGKVTK